MNKLTSIVLALTTVCTAACLDQETVTPDADIHTPTNDAAPDGHVVEPGPGGTHTRFAILPRFFTPDGTELTCREVVDAGYKLSLSVAKPSGSIALPAPEMLDCYDDLHPNTNLRYFSGVWVYNHPEPSMVELTISGSPIKYTLATSPEDHEFGFADRTVTLIVF